MSLGFQKYRLARAAGKKNADGKSSEADEVIDEDIDEVVDEVADDAAKDDKSQEGPSCSAQPREEVNLAPPFRLPNGEILTEEPEGFGCADGVLSDEALELPYAKELPYADISEDEFLMDIDAE